MAELTAGQLKAWRAKMSQSNLEDALKFAPDTHRRRRTARALYVAARRRCKQHRFKPRKLKLKMQAIVAVAMRYAEEPADEENEWTFL